MPYRSSTAASDQKAEFVRERGGDQLTVWETFKVYDGQIHAVEAFVRILPVEKRNGGWE